jgi:hypothetical protein
MLVFNKEDIAGNSITVTLTELSNIAASGIEPYYYLFIFTHVETKTQLKKILADADDISEFKYRYNQWEIEDIEDFLGDAPDGQYTYEVYEQLSSTDEGTTGKNIVEKGKMIILADGFSFEKYNTETTYKSYNG